MAYLILGIFLLCCIWKIAQGKDALSVVLFYYFIAPNISIGGGLVVDSSYIFVFVLIVISAIFFNGKIKVTRQVKSLTILITVWIITYTMGWLANGANSQLTFGIAILGLIKTLISVVLCLSLSRNMSKKMIYRSIGKGLSWTIWANAVAVALQFFFPYQMYDVCYELYYSASSSGYTSYEKIESWGSGFYGGRYYRYFGLNETPMVLSCIVVLVLTIMLIQVITEKRFFIHLRILGVVTILVGVAAQCKIFFLMLPVLALLYVWFNSNKLNRGKIYLYTSGCVACIFLLVFFDEISSISVLRYLTYLKSPLEAFATRFGDGAGSSGYLTETLGIAFDHFLTGVGPISISGEPIADSSFVVIFHNGGIIALFAMIVFYWDIAFKNLKRGNNANNILVISMLVMGLSRTNLIFGNLLIATLFYLYADCKKERRETIIYDNVAKRT